MSENVSRLKELLFEGESRTLAELQKRIDAVASQEVRTRAELAQELKRLAEAHPAEIKRLAEAITSDRTVLRRFAEMSERDRAELRRLLEQTGERQTETAHRLDGVLDRVGTPERLEQSVAGIIDGALRRAEVDRHSELAGAIAPLVVRTIKTEIRNSQDELAEALYPMTGRMVKAYVASAMKDLVEQINRRLEQNAFMLRLRSIMTGRPVAELALADSQRVEVQEMYLIRRGSGELVARWPQTGGESSRDQVMSGILTAINDFASEAFKGEGSALRHIDLEASQVYLRASPAYLLAVRCNGTAHAAVESVIDAEFLRTIDRHGADLASDKAPAGGTDYQPLLADLSRQLVQRVDETQASLAQPLRGVSPFKILVAAIALPLVAWLGWTAAEGFASGRVREVAAHVIESSTEIKGYPVAVEVGRWGQTLTLTGLAPSDAAREDVVKRMSGLLAGTDIRDQLSVVPTGGFDTRPQIADMRRQIARIDADMTRLALQRTIGRARLRLEQAVPDLALLGGAVAGDASRQTVRDVSVAVSRTIEALRAEHQKLGSRQGRGNDLGEVKERLAPLPKALATAGSDLAGIIGEGARASLTHADTARTAASDIGEDIAAQAERLGAMAIAVHQATLAASRQPPQMVAAPTPREELIRWVHANAVFFSNGTDYRNDAAASATLDAAAKMIKAAKTRVRIVGYTDEPGGSALNATLSQARAARVQADLADRGVPAGLMVTLGRTQGPNISPTTGPQSPNRRAVFEIAFDGEEAE
jgi:outer membrane protein OmpA-like peptidoglycan-associated protein